MQSTRTGAGGDAGGLHAAKYTSANAAPPHAGRQPRGGERFRRTIGRAKLAKGQTAEAPVLFKRTSTYDAHNDDKMVPHDFARTTLRPADRRVVRALAEALFSVPEDDQELPPSRLDGLVAEVDTFVSPATRTTRFGLRLLLAALEWSPLFFLRFRTFSGSAREERVRHLERLERSRVTALALLVFGYKTMLTMLFYEDPREQAAIGYPGAERRRHRLVVHPGARE